MIIALDISVLADKQKTGIGIYTYNLINHLIKINNQDKFILFGIASFQSYAFLKNLPFKDYPNVSIKVFPLPLKLFRLTFLIWQKINWPNIEIFIGKVDIFHSFNFYLPPQRWGKIVATIFDMTPQLFPHAHKKKTLQLERERIDRIKKKADLVITISENTKRDFKKLCPQTPVEVVYPGASEIFTPKIDQAKTKQVLNKYKLEPGYFLSVATLEPRKNLERLIKAYFKSSLKRPLVLVGGKGWKYQKIMELLNHKNKIKLTGFVPDEDLVCLYQQSLCLIYPSLYEGFGMPVLEALSSGTAVICSKISSIPEVGGRAVLYVDPKDTNSITKALIKIQNRQLRVGLINKGLKQAKKFSWKKSAERLNQLYQPNRRTNNPARTAFNKTSPKKIAKNIF